MNRFFFDVLGAKSHSYDYHGRDFRLSDEARDMAELIALDLSCSETEDWIGSEVHVRNAAGVTLFSVPIQAALELKIA